MIAVAFFALSFFVCENLRFSIICCGAMRLDSSKAQLRFAYCALVLKIAFCFCGATFLMLRGQLCTGGTLDHD
jgi:hypothetical protein